MPKAISCLNRAGARRKQVKGVSWASHEWEIENNKDGLWYFWEANVEPVIFRAVFFACKYARFGTKNRTIFRQIEQIQIVSKSTVVPRLVFIFAWSSLIELRTKSRRRFRRKKRLKWVDGVCNRKCTKSNDWLGKEEGAPISASWRARTFGAIEITNVSITQFVVWVDLLSSAAGAYRAHISH